MFTIKGPEEDWLAHCQHKVTGWGIMLICSMVLHCAGTLACVHTSTSDLTP